jgi:hypothetical protein
MKYHLIKEDFDTRVHATEDGELDSWKDVQAEVREYFLGTQAACLQILNSETYEQYEAHESATEAPNRMSYNEAYEKYLAVNFGSPVVDHPNEYLSELVDNVWVLSNINGELARVDRHGRVDQPQPTE